MNSSKKTKLISAYSKFITSIIVMLGIWGMAHAQQRPQLPLKDHIHNDQCTRDHHREKVQLSVSKNHDKVRPNKNLTNHETSTKNLLKAVQAPCASTLQDIANFTTTELFTFLETTTDYDCITGLFFEYENPYTKDIFSPANLTAVIEKAKEVFANYDGTYASGVYGYIVYIRLATYWEFFVPDEVSLTEQQTADIVIASEILTNSGHLLDQNEAAYNILGEFMSILDNDGFRHQDFTIDLMTQMFNHLTVIDSWKNVPDNLMFDYSAAYNSAFFILFRGIANGDDEYTSILTQNEAFLDALANVALDDELGDNEDLAFIQNNAVSELVRNAEVDGVWDIIKDNVVGILDEYEYLSIQWIQAVEVINDQGDCEVYDVCYSDEGLKELVEDYLFTKNYSFDDGKLIIKSAMDEDKVQELYHAVKQVQAQFFKLTQTDEPLTGDPNDVLYLVVFGTNQQYIDYGGYFYSVPTDAGGVYYEGESTFYTYDRETGLSLEALFRHEYVHYLQGRYWIPGFWGNAPLYQDDRMVWLEEGGAEFFAGSTDTDSIKLLRQSGSRIVNQGSGFPSLSELLNTNYFGGIHYTYGNAYWYYMYLNEYDSMHELISLLRDDNVSGFDSWIDARENSAAANNNFQSFLGDIADGTIKYWEPETDWLTDRELHVGSPDDILSEWLSAGGSNATASMDAESLNRRFRLEGSLPITGSDEALNYGIENMLKEVRDNSSVNNLDYTVGYLKNYSNNSADFVITGPLRNRTIDDEVSVEFRTNNRSTIVGAEVSFENKSTGYTSSFEWTFPGATPSASNEEHPVVVYNTPGTYAVTLKVSGNDNSEDVLTKTEYITVYNTGDESYCTPSNGYDYTYIRNFELGSIDNDSDAAGFTNNGYQDFSNVLSTQLQLGQSYDFTVGFHYNATKILAMWIDYNQDGDFEDAGEKVHETFNHDGASLMGNFMVPANALPGGTRLRVRLSYSESFMNGSNPSCGEDGSMGEVEDYTVILVEDATSVLIPIANFESDVNSIVRNESVNFTDLSLNQPTSWEWTFEGGEPATSTDPNPTVVYPNAGVFVVTLKVTNEAGSDIKMGNIFVAKGGGEDGDYCEVSNEQSEIYITNVSMGDINNNSGFSENGYGDYTDQSTEVEAGSQYSISVSTQLDWSYNTVKAWADWNQDGDFNDTGEEILYDGYDYDVSTDLFTGTFSVPDNALPGTTRLRVRLAYSTDPTPCGKQPDRSGETEDYSIVVKNEPVSNVLSQITSINNNQEFYSNEEIFVKVNASGDKGIKEVQIWLFDGNTWSLLIPLSVPPYQVNIGKYPVGSYELRATAVDNDGNESSDLISFSVLDVITNLTNLKQDEISIFPNPASDIVYINGASINKVTLYDIAGNQVINKAANINQINIGDLPSGIYMIRVVSKENTITRRLVKQ